MTAPTSKRAAAPGALFAAIALTLAVLVVTALQPSQPPPPPVAEYAPEAVQAVKDAPPEQSAESGIGDDGAGGSAGGATTTTVPAGAPTTPPPTTGPPAGPVVLQTRVRRCVGNPPRQTEDPQSPPCVPYFDPAQDNGGTTAVGVTKNEIRVAMPNRSNTFEQLRRYFNSRYEMYGRQIVYVDGGCFGGSPSSARNLADSLAKQKVFGVVTYCDIKGSEFFFYEQLAKNKIVSVADKPSLATEADYARVHPYAWTYLPTYDKGIRHLGELACSMAGQRATNAGPAYVTSTRKFGLVTATYDDAPNPDVSAILATLKACGVDPVRAEVKQERDAGTTQGASQATVQQSQSAALRFSQAGVTTVLVLLHSEVTRQLLSSFDGQGYQPEIGLTSYLYNDQDLFYSATPASQAAHTFGISTWNKLGRVADEPWFQAVNEVEPGHVYQYAPGDYSGTNFEYRSLQVLAAGIQMAGPNLTPESFAAGLQRAKWPNPEHPTMPGKVTVSPGTHSYMEDAAVIWWDPASNSPEYGSTTGAFCYVEDGRRRAFGHYPKQTGLFQRPCQRF